MCRVAGLGPVTARTVREWLGRADVSVTVRPVVVPDPPPVDGYEIPQAIRAAVAARHIGSVYPWSSAAGPAVDLDHTSAYVPADRDGPPGQTGVDTLGPLTRREHRHKTFGHLRARQPVPGVFLWRSRHGWVWLVTNTGTHPLGRSPAADALWQAATPKAAAPGAERRTGPPSRGAVRATITPPFRIDLVRSRVETRCVLRT